MRYIDQFVECSTTICSHQSKSIFTLRFNIVENDYGIGQAIDTVHTLRIQSISIRNRKYLLTATYIVLLTVEKFSSSKFPTVLGRCYLQNPNLMNLAVSNPYIVTT